MKKESRGNTYEVGDHHIFRCKPGDYVEVTQRREQQSRQEIERNSTKEHSDEKLARGYCPTIGRLVLLFV
jgi:hypothetical protein